MRGDRLKNAREAMGLTQEELAARVKVSAQQIYRLENGISSNPKAETLVDIAKELDVSVDYLLDLTDDTKGRYSTVELTPDEIQLLLYGKQGILPQLLEFAAFLLRSREETKKDAKKVLG